MAVFVDEPATYRRLDWGILQNSSISLYADSERFKQAIHWFRAHRYEIVSLDTEQWHSESDCYAALYKALKCPDDAAQNINALRDYLSYLSSRIEPSLTIEDDGGLLLALRNIEVVHERLPEFLRYLLDAFEENSRHALLFGLRWITLLQSNDPHLWFDPVGARPICRSCPTPG